MSDPNATSGAGHTDVGDEGEGGSTQTPKSVSYEAHQRLLSEKKKFQQQAKEAADKLKVFEDEKKAKENEQEINKGNYAKLEKQLKDELEQERAKNKTLLANEIRRTKEAAILAASKGSLKSKALTLIDYDSILLEDDGTVNELSVQKSLKSFKSEWPEMFQESSGNLPNGAPRGNAKEGLMTYEKWLKLPRAEREKIPPTQLAD